jgi:hypothetical protein
MSNNGELHSAFQKSLPDVMALFDKPVEPAAPAHPGSPHENGPSSSPRSDSPAAPGPSHGGPSHGGASHDPAPATSEPAVMKDYTQVGGQSGSNVGGRFVDPAGKEWYVKAPVSDLHAKNEVLANDLYRAAGVPVPEVKLLDLNGNFGDRHLGVQSGIVEGSQNLGAHLNDPVYLDELHQNFAVDAWLGNWDSVGLVYDNVMATDSGLLRIDAGGSLLFRAQGGPKGPLFTDTVGEIDSLRNPTINPQSAKVFEGVTDDHIRAGVAKIQAISEHQIDQMVDRHDFAPDDAAYLKDKIKARRDDLISRYGEPEPTGTHPAESPGTQLGQAHDTPAQSEAFDIPTTNKQWSNYWNDFATGHPADYVIAPPEPLAGEHGAPTQPLGEQAPVEPPKVEDTPPVQDAPYTIPSDKATAISKYADAYEQATKPPGEEAGTPTNPLNLPKWSDFWDSEKGKPVENPTWSPGHPIADEHGAPMEPPATTHEPIDPSKLPTQPLSGDPTTDPTAVHDPTKNPVADAPEYYIPDVDPSADPPIDSLQVPPSYGEKVWDDVVNNLSPEHEKSVKFYSSSGYHQINDFMRSKDPNYSVSDEVKGHIQNLSDVAKMRPVPHDIDVIRAVGQDAFSVPMRKLKGTVQSDAAFMSTNLGQDPVFSDTVILHLRVPAGTPAIYVDRISSCPGERELLLTSGRRWIPTHVEIRKDEYGHKKYHVYGRLLPD